MLIGVCFLQTTAWSRLGLELCVRVCAHVCAHMFVGICHFVFVHVCIFFFYTDSWLAFSHTHKDVHTQLSAQSPVGRRPRARPHIWQESNWACLMADIQERRRERQTCSDEGEWRAISIESWFSLPLALSLSLSPSQLSITIKWMLCQLSKRHFFPYLLTFFLSLLIYFFLIYILFKIKRIRWPFKVTTDSTYHHESSVPIFFMHRCLNVPQKRVKQPSM